MVSAGVLDVAHMERHLSDGQRRSRIRLEEVSLAPGVVHGLCGPSGIGKTTALEMLSLASRPDIIGRMRLQWQGEAIDVAELLESEGNESVARLRGRLFGYVLQASRLLPFLTVEENICLSQHIAGVTDPAFIGMLMERLDISGLVNVYPSGLSGGQRQRVSIARALAHRPAVVLADEPTSAVDQEIAETVMGLLIDYAHASGASVLVITHNVDLARRSGLTLLRVESQIRDHTLETVIGRAGAQA